MSNLTNYVRAAFQVASTQTAVFALLYAVTSTAILLFSDDFWWVPIAVAAAYWALKLYFKIDILGGMKNKDKADLY